MNCSREACNCIQVIFRSSCIWSEAINIHDMLYRFICFLKHIMNRIRRIDAIIDFTKVPKHAVSFSWYLLVWCRTMKLRRRITTTKVSNHLIKVPKHGSFIHEIKISIHFLRCRSMISSWSRDDKLSRLLKLAKIWNILLKFLKCLLRSGDDDE